MGKKNYSVSVIQLELNNSPDENRKKCIAWIRKAANDGAEVICLPELYSSHYFCQREEVENFSFAERLGAVSFTAFSALASELGVVIIVPFFEKRTAGIYHNSAYIIDTDGKQAGLYRKMHIPMTHIFTKNSTLLRISTFSKKLHYISIIISNG